MREWSWWEVVAQLDEESTRYVVEDGEPGRGLVGCEVRARPNPYDHQRHVRNPGKGPQLREWDFVLKRSIATAAGLG